MHWTRSIQWKLTTLYQYKIVSTNASFHVLSIDGGFLVVDEAFAAKHMPDLGHEVKDFQVFTWRLTNWKKLEKKITSPEFECGGHKWFVANCPASRRSLLNALFRRILLFPFGNSNAPPNDTVSVYLDYAEPKKAPEGWHACAQFALVISNIYDPAIYTVSRMLGHRQRVCRHLTNVFRRRCSPPFHRRRIRLGIYSL